MKILVLSNAFAQRCSNIRLRYQCENLSKLGHEIEVYTEILDPINFEHSYPIHEIGEVSTNSLKLFWLSFYSLLTNFKERKFVYQVIWLSRKFKFDMVFCSTNSCFPLSAAAMIAKIKGVPLFVDLSDMEELSPMYEKYPWWRTIEALKQHVYIKRRNQALRQAQWITTLSAEHVEVVKKINPHVSLIYSGFDPKQYYFEATQTDTFRINFFGYAFDSQNIDMVLHVMEKFKDELPKAQWSFYSEDLHYNHFKYSRPNICGLLPSEVVGDAIRQSSMIMLFHDSEDNGLSSESFYQALGCEKPVLFTPASEGAVPNLIQMTNLGIATRSVKECMNYIRDYYHQWEQDGFTHREVQNKDLFNAEEQAKELEKLMLLAVKK